MCDCANGMGQLVQLASAHGEHVGWPECVSEWRRGGGAGQARVLCDSVSEIISVCWCRLSKNLQLFIVVSAVSAAAASRSSFLPLLAKLFRCVFVLRELCHRVPTERCARMCPDGIVLSRPLQYHPLVARHAVFSQQMVVSVAPNTTAEGRGPRAGGRRSRWNIAWVDVGQFRFTR